MVNTINLVGTPALPFTRSRLNDEQVCHLILGSGRVTIRDVSGGELPFEYSDSSPDNPIFGPGYLLIKAIVSQDEIFWALVNELALRVEDYGLRFDGICGNVSGGMVPGYLLKIYLAHIYGRPVSYIYARGARKDYGSQELLVGIDEDEGKLSEGDLVFGDVEELVNNAKTTCTAAEALRDAGLRIDHALCLFDYDNSIANARRTEKGLTQISLITLPKFIEYARARQHWPDHVLDDYLSYTSDPIAWRERNSGAIQRALAAKARES